MSMDEKSQKSSKNQVKRSFKNQKTSHWYKDAFGKFYPILYSHLDEAAAERDINQLINRFQLTGDERILDVCCGEGRHLSALLKKGFDAWGVDFSGYLLKKAAVRRETSGRILRADIRAIPFKNCFHVALNLFTSFGYFLDDEQNLTALKEMAVTLKPGGWLVVDHINRSFLQANLIRRSQERRQGYDIIQRRCIQGKRVIKEITLTSRDGKVTELTENVRLFSLEEIKGFFTAAGIGDVCCWGSLEGEPFNQETPRMVIVGRKK